MTEHAIQKLADDLGISAEMMTPEVRASLMMMEAQRQQLVRLLTQQSRFTQGEPPVGEVLKFVKGYPGGRYTYVAFHAPDGMWYMTGRAYDTELPNRYYDNRSKMGWEFLRKFIGDSTVERAVSWETVV